MSVYPHLPALGSGSRNGQLGVAGASGTGRMGFQPRLCLELTGLRTPYPSLHSSRGKSPAKPESCGRVPRGLGLL